MKKIISILLALIMALSVSVVAFAADNSIKLDKRTVKTITDDSLCEFYFNAPSSGVYEVKIELLDEGEVSVYLYSSYSETGSDDLVDLYLDTYTEGNDIVEEKILVDKEVEYYFGVWNQCEEDLDVAITVTKSSAAAISLGKNKTEAISDSYFLFTPTKDGYYNFRSEKCDDYDPGIIIKDAYCYIDGNHDSGYEDDMDFDVTVYMKKDKTYLINVFSLGNEKNQYGEITYTISYNKDIKVEDIYCWFSYEEVTLNIGDEYWDVVSVVPYGATPTADITVESSNEDVVYVEYYAETGDLYVYANNSGTATITISGADGVSTSFDVKVYSRIETFFRTLIERIIDILSGILYFGF